MRSGFNTEVLDYHQYSKKAIFFRVNDWPNGSMYFILWTDESVLGRGQVEKISCIGP